MDAQQFLAEFGHIANAPGGVARLRELVLYLAITGKLVSQNESDFEAHSLLEEMTLKASEKSSKKKSAAKKKTINQQYISESKVPPNWVVADLAELGEWGAGCTPSRSNPTYYGGRTPWFKSGELKSDFISIAEEHVSELALKECSLRLNAPGDVLIAMYGANIGQTSIIEVESTTNQAVCACTPHQGLSNKFLLIALKALKRFFIALGAGGAQPNISKAKIVATRIGLPPTEEQSRIVAKVDELMALCDKLEAQQQQRRTLQNHLRQATLQAVAASQSPHELQESWQRLQANFGQLFSAPEDVEELRSAVLDLAISGYLSEASPADEAVDAFLERNNRSKQERLSSGEMKRKKASATDVHQLELEISDHWAKVALEDLFQFIDYRGKTPPKTESGVVLVTAKNVRPRRLNKEPVEYISEKSYKEWMTRGFPKTGDLLFTTEAPLGNVALIEQEPSFALAQRVIDFQPFADLNTKCAMYFMMSPTYQNLLEKNSTGMTAKGIKAAKLKQLLLPTPPIPEQQRIVDRIELLMTICDDLEKSLNNAGKVATSLAAASVASLTGIAIEQEEEPMKAPKTELVAPVRLGTPPDVKAQAPLATILARHNGEMSAKDLWQRFGGEIDAFYAQLKTEVAHGWLLEPEVAEMHEKASS